MQGRCSDSRGLPADGEEGALQGGVVLQQVQRHLGRAAQQPQPLVHRLRMAKSAI